MLNVTRLVKALTLILYWWKHWNEEMASLIPEGKDPKPGLVPV